MSLTIQIGKGFTAVPCDDCGTPFWMKAEKAQSMTAAGKRVSCRDCQIFKGYEVPAWPCARRLTEHEQDELQMEADRATLAERKDEPSVPAEEVLQPQQNTMTLAELREKLKYYLEVTKTSQKAFADSCDVSAFTINRFLGGDGIRNATRFAIVAEMEKRGWLAEVPAEEPKTEPAPEEPKPEEPQPKPELVLPYPAIKELPTDGDMRELSRYLANFLTMVLHEEPNHPKRAEVEEKIREHKRTAEMTDEEFNAHRVWEANPINKLTQDEKLTCIRTLPIPIVQKLFPHL